MRPLKLTMVVFMTHSRHLTSWLVLSCLLATCLPLTMTQEKGIWGPFLVVAPASVLSNWADEMAR